MIAYKGFQKGLSAAATSSCRGLTERKRQTGRENGFHCAENPLDCLSYYSDMDESEYYIVNAGGDMDEDGSDTKISCTELTVLKRLSREDFFLHSLAYMADHPLREWNIHVRKDRAEAYWGYAIVRGIDPAARGKTGDMLAFAKEDPVSGRIVQIALAQIDGKKVRPDTWYGTDLTERQVALI